jgi:hypothetical protein
MAMQGDFFNFNLAMEDLHDTNANGGPRYDWQYAGSARAESESEASLQIEFEPSKTDTPEELSLFDMSPTQAGELAATAISAGVVWWAGRSIGLLAALMASVPAWRSVDPLPILARDRRRGRAGGDELLPDDTEPNDSFQADPHAAAAGLRRAGSPAVLPPSTLMSEIES